MSFIESPRFPECISYGAIGGPGFNTSIVVVKSGAESRNAEWSEARHRYDVSQAAKKKEDFEEVASFFRVVKGRAYGFRFKDFADYQCDFSHGELGNGDGTSGPFQMVKRYLSGSHYYDRIISKPVVGKIEIRRGGNPVVIGSGAGQASIDYTKGQVSFVADAEDDVTDLIVGSTTDVEFTINPGSFIANQYIYLDGFTGADGDVLNGKAHKINSISGSGPYVFNLDINTTGMTITYGSAKGYKYPQSNEVITWAGEFDVPCRFDTDDLSAEIVGPNQIMRWDGIPIVEIRL